MGCELMLHVRIDFEEYHPEGIDPFWAPNLLWRVQTPDCFDTLRIPDLLQHTPQDEWNLKDRTDRRRAYEILIRRGLPQQMIRWLDGALLVDLWDELDLPDPVRKVWLPAIAVAREGRFVGDIFHRHGQDPETAAYARIRGFELLPPPPPPPHLGGPASTRDLHLTLAPLGSRRCCSASPPTPWSPRGVLSFGARAYVSPTSSHCLLRVPTRPRSWRTTRT